jgi:glutamate-5-semialdehyde dehydrogenase
LKADRYIDLVVPRGSNDLVRYIQSNTRIPVLGHADGLCHLYIDADADLNKALRIAIDAKTQYPAACNSIETLLLHESIARQFLEIIVPALVDKNVEIRCDTRSMSLLSDALKEKALPASQSDWETEYCELIIAVKVVASLEEAIEHINYYGSHHTETIVTEKQANFERFFNEVNSAGVFCNASTRFADGFRYGFGAELGISTGKLHPRGPVGLDGLVTYKYKLIGDGHIVADYTGETGRTFTHRNLKET